MSKAEAIDKAAIWLHETVREMVDSPEDVSLTTSETTRVAVEFQLRVHPDDVGKVIGKQGRNIRALRTVLLAMGRKLGMYLEISLEDSVAPLALESVVFERPEAIR